jgi:glycerol uptake facilitator-like aquaporin
MHSMKLRLAAGVLRHLLARARWLWRRRPRGQLPRRAFAFGLTVLTMAYAVGHISGGHFNPAVTIGLATGKRFDWKDVPAYVATQVVAAIVAAFVLFVIAHGARASTRRRAASPPTGTATAPPAATTCWRCCSSRS